MNRRRLIDGLTAYGALYVVFLYAPLFILPLFSFNDSIYVAFPLQGFTTRWYAAMVDNPSLGHALWNSVKVAAAVAVISTGAGLMAARAITGARFHGRSAVTGLIMAPLVVPGIIFGVALLILFRSLLDLDLTLYTIGAGHLLICIPYATFVLTSRLEGFDRSLEEASLNLGESAWSTFWRIVFPLALPGIVSSLLLAFTISFDEVVLAFFLSGTEQTLPIYIFSQLRFPARLPSVLALGSCILLGSVILIALAQWMERRPSGASRAAS